ncbi:MAG: hypothetical protein H2057_06035 [Alphaproteobacteria bacterium]|nr:hypothetical protein [Alphaproteobacteria bacterium]
MIKKNLSVLLLGAALVVATPHTASASSMILDGVHLTKEQDPNSRAVRIKAIFTDPEDLQEIRSELYDPETTHMLRPLTATNLITYTDTAYGLTLTVSRSVVPLLVPFLKSVFNEDISPYIAQFDQAPSSSVAFNEDFNPMLYALYNPDVRSVHNDSLGPIDTFLIKHFVEYGFDENRKHKLPADFNATRYLQLNPDIAAMAYSQSDPNYAAIKHFVEYGEAERRAFTIALPNDFDVEEYLALNPDVATAASKEPSYARRTFAENHYRNSGFLEKRSFKIAVPADFDPYYYLKYNADVNAALISLPYFEQMAHAKLHYAANGQREQRRYK